jgi:hypothetical protein
MADQIDMHHPETGGEGKTTEQQLRDVWEPRGWKRGLAADAPAAEPGGTEAGLAGDGTGEDVDPPLDTTTPVPRSPRRAGK